MEATKISSRMLLVGWHPAQRPREDAGRGFWEVGRAPARATRRPGWEATCKGLHGQDRVGVGRKSLSAIRIRQQNHHVNMLTRSNTSSKSSCNVPKPKHTVFLQVGNIFLNLYFDSFISIHTYIHTYIQRERCICLDIQIYRERERATESKRGMQMFICTYIERKKHIYI